MADPAAVKYWAFISYSHGDQAAARQLHRWLERYRLPRKLAGTRSDRLGRARPAQLRPVYRDVDEFSAGQDLGEHIKAALRESEALVVVCSPRVMASRWVGDEIAYFRSIGRADRIFLFVVDGDPGAREGPLQCIPASARGAHDGSADPMAADARPKVGNFRIAALRLVAGVVDVGFDELRRRDQERRVRVLAGITVAALALLVLVAGLALDAMQQRDAARQQQELADQRRQQAEQATARAESATRDALSARQLAEERQRDADAARQVADQKRAEADAARELAQQRLKDATMRRLALESRAMSEGVRPGGSLTAARIALAGLAMQDRPDLYGALHATIAFDDSLRAWESGGSGASALAYGPDGRWIVGVVSEENSSRLVFWKPDGTPDGAGLPVDGYVIDMALASDGRTIATLTMDGNAAIWDVTTRTLRARLPERAAYAFHPVALSAQGDRLLTAGRDDTSSVLWQVDGKPKPIGELRHPGVVVAYAEFSPEGRFIVTAARNGQIALWDGRTGLPVGEPIPAHGGEVTGLSLQPGRVLMATCGEDKLIRLWRLDDHLTPLAQIDTGMAGVHRVKISPDGERVAALTSDQKVALWDIATGQPLGVPLAGHRRAVGGLVFSPDGERLATAGRIDGTVRLWDGFGRSGFGPQRDPRQATLHALAMAPRKGDQRAVAADVNGLVVQWDATTGTRRGATLQLPPFGVNAVTYSPDGSQLIVSQRDRTLQRFDAATGARVGEPMQGHLQRVGALAVSAAAGVLASGDDSGQVLLWGSGAATEPRLMAPLSRPIKNLAFSPDGRRLAASGLRELFALWDVASGRLLYQSPPGAPRSRAYAGLSFSPDGRWVASGNTRVGGPRLWDGHHGRPVDRAFLGHRFSVVTVSFSADGKLLAGGGGDGEVRFWDVETGEPIAPPFVVNGEVSALGFTADGSRLVATSIAQTQATFSWPGPAVWRDLACRRLTRNLTRAEWNHSIGSLWPYVVQCPALPGP